MGSKATHQFPTLSSLELTDLFYVVREESPGVFKDYSVPRSLLPESTDVSIVLLTNAQILALFTTPIELVPAPPSTSIIVVKLITMQAVNGTAAWDGGLWIGGDVIDATNFLVAAPFPDLDRPAPYNVIYPASAGSGIMQGMAPGEALRIKGDGADPEDGDGDVLVKVYYSLING